MFSLAYNLNAGEMITMWMTLKSGVITVHRNVDDNDFEWKINENINYN